MGEVQRFKIPTQPEQQEVAEGPKSQPANAKEALKVLSEQDQALHAQLLENIKGQLGKFKSREERRGGFQEIQALREKALGEISAKMEKALLALREQAGSQSRVDLIARLTPENFDELILTTSDRYKDPTGRYEVARNADDLRGKEQNELVKFIFGVDVAEQKQEADGGGAGVEDNRGEDEVNYTKAGDEEETNPKAKRMSLDEQIAKATKDGDRELAQKLINLAMKNS